MVVSWLKPGYETACQEDRPPAVQDGFVAVETAEWFLRFWGCNEKQSAILGKIAERLRSPILKGTSVEAIENLGWKGEIKEVLLQHAQDEVKIHVAWTGPVWPWSCSKVYTFLEMSASGMPVEGITIENGRLVACPPARLKDAEYLARLGYYSLTGHWGK